MQKGKLRIGVGITSFAILLVALASGGIVGFNFYQGSKLARERTEADIQTVISRIERQAQSLIAPVAPTLNSIVTLSKHTDLNADLAQPLRDLTLPLLTRHPQISSVYIGFANGQFTQLVSFVGKGTAFKTPYAATEHAEFALVQTDVEGPAGRGRTVQPLSPAGSFDEAPWYETTTYDPRERPWYGPAIKRAGPYRTAPYVFAKSRKPGLTISRRLDGDGAGVAGIDLDLRTLKEFLTSMKFTSGTRLAIVTAKGRILAHTHLETASTNELGTLTLNRLEDAGDEVLLTLSGTAADGSAIQEVEAGGASFVGRSIDMDLGGPVPEKLLVAVPWNEVVGPLVSARNRSILIALAIALAVMALAFTLSRRIARPVEALTEEARRVSRLELEPQATQKSVITEIDELGDAMTSMKSALSVFGRYVPRTLVRQLVETGSGGELGGTRRDLAIMFSDIEGFTTLSEDQQPEDLMHQLSDYFESQSSAVLRNKGTIDKYIGDAVMAFWNAPVPDHEMARNACLSVLEARAALAPLNKKWDAEGRPPLYTRYGLHLGPVIVGNVGSTERINYTAMGATANLASRLEGLNKFFGTQVIASDPVRRQAGEEFVWRPIGVVMPKGVTKPLRIYELLGLRAEIGSKPDIAPLETPELVQAALWDSAFQSYLSRNWGTAQKQFKDWLKHVPDDLTARFYLKRCKQLLARDPGPEWQGIEAFDAK
ncbi:MAG: adenylate/guanylate cyclase domain-containing protein [Pseudomonadota bacterium]